MDHLMAAAARDSAGENKDINTSLDADPRLKAEDKTWAKSFFDQLGASKIEDLVDINTLQPLWHQTCRNQGERKHQDSKFEK